ncbi:hemicentin-1-like [Sardina pilchardus]|uniref:hemicentin-1-like n=1 Tax=Sardina pilchardus TaxID=27697 RepID=UPI002E0DB7F7
MKMEYIVPFALFLHLCLGQVVVPPDTPTAIEVGQNVTLRANHSHTILAGTWNFETTTIILWYPGNELPTPQYDGRIVFNTSDASLTLTSLQVDDSGDYGLNGLDPVFQRQFVLSVQERISNVTTTVSKTNLIEINDTVTLSCSASGTPLRFLWINGTSVVTASEQIKFSEDNSVLTIMEVTRFDTGPFSCNVSNNISHDASLTPTLNISYGPSNLMLEVAPYKMAYISGSNVDLTCSADSKPAASYEWLFNDISLNKFGENLELTDLEMSETGQYTCLVHNSVTSRYEQISKSLTIVDPISSVVVNEVGRPPILNMTFTLRCDVIGPHVDSIHWMKDNTSLSPDNSISISHDNTTLTFTSVEMSDNGMYWCMAFNPVSNNTSNEYKLTVNYGPKMPVISGPSIIATADNLMLTCSAESEPPSNFTWYFDDTVMMGPDYKLDSVSLSNSGNYTCSAHNDITNITKMVTKEVKVIHLISSATIKITGNPPVDHKLFVLTCDAVGTVYERDWMMDGMALNLNMSRMNLSDDNSMLTFDPVLKSDDGNYTCMASNPLNNDTSPMFSLKVNYGPKMPVITGPMGPVKTGSNVTLNCNADSKPPSNYTWYFNDGNMMESGSMYVINEATPSDSGIYTCVAMNDVTKQNSSAVKELEVIDPISAVLIMKGEPPILNMTFTLTCDVTGPVESIHWMKSSDYLQTTEDNRISFTDGNKTLTFSPVMHSDDGDYKCSASNAVSNKSSNFTLKVNYGPDNVTISGPSTLSTGSNVTFTCDASSWPESSISWFFNGSEVEMSSVYKKYSLSPADSGEYSCTAHNNMTGRSSSVTKMLTVIDLISNVMVNEDDGSPILNMTFILSCDMTGPVESIHWMVNSSSYLQANDTISFSNENKTLTFKHVDHSDNGNYQCVAMNAVSKLNSSEYILMVNYGPWDTVITGPQNAKSGSGVTFHCSATSLPPSVYSWYYNGSMVGEGALLELFNLTLNKSGEYTCKAHNNKTNMSSSVSTHLRVITPLTVVTIETEGQLPILGKSFKCNCSANSEITSIYWMKNGSLSWNGTVSLSEDNVTMTIDSVTHDDDGEYQCTAQNDVSNMTSSVYDLRVNFGPKNVVISGPKLAETGANVTFNCSATSWPPSSFSWYFNSSWVAKGSSYTTEPLALDGSGEYTCMAHNNVTELNSSASIELEVFIAPTPIVVKPKPVIPMDSEDFSLYCDIAGPYNSIQWYRDSRALIFNNSIMPTISNDSTTVSFKPLKRANDGKYQCVVENVVTRHYSESYDLRASYGPSEVVISITTENPFTLTCKADSQPPSEFEWSVDDEPKGNGSSIEMTLFAALMLETITCKATNPLTNETVTATFEIPDLSAAPPLQSRVDLTLTVLLALSLCLLGNRFY